MSSELPNRNLPLDILCTQVLCKIIVKALETVRPEEFQNSSDIVDSFLATNLRNMLDVQFNIQISREQALPRLQSTFELARACDSSDAKFRNVIELMSKADRSSCKELLRLDKSFRSQVMKSQHGSKSGNENGRGSSDSSAKRRKTDTEGTAAAAAASNSSFSSSAPRSLSKRQSSSDSIVDLTEPDDSSNRYVSLNPSTKDSDDVTVSMQQIRVEDLVQYLFQVIEVQKEESRMLRSAIERQARYLGKIDQQQEHIFQSLKHLRAELSGAGVVRADANHASANAAVHLSPKSVKGFLPNPASNLPANQVPMSMQPLRHQSSGSGAVSVQPTQGPAPAISEFADFLKKI